MFFVGSYVQKLDKKLVNLIWNWGAYEKNQLRF